jgi:hypothetical protein
MESQDSNNNVKLTTFSQEEATPNTSSKINEKKSDNILNKDMVTRPLLWGIVIFLIFFSLVIGGTSVYRMYVIDEFSQSTNNTVSTPEVVTQVNPAIDDSSTVSADIPKEANLIESEIKNIDTDLEEDVYSDSSLGL